MLKFTSLFKWLLPKGIYSRIILIQLVPIVLLQLLVVYIFFDKYVDYISQQQQKSVLNELKYISAQIEKREQNEGLLKDLEMLELNLRISNVEPILQYSQKQEQFENFKKMMLNYLPRGSKFWSDQENKITIFVIPLTNDKFLIAEIASRKLWSPRAKIFIYWIIVATIFFILLSLLFIKNQIKSILKLARTAERMSKGHAIDDFSPSGSSEIRIAGDAILKLQRRINRQVKYRTEMLAHISHDLRTPLTRFKLMITQIKNNKELQDNFKEEIKEMEDMITSYLDFAKGEGNEESKEIDLVVLIKTTISKIKDERIKIKSDCKECKMIVRPNAIKRAFTNILRNAITHAKEHIIIKIRKTNDYLYIYCEDDGPGIPIEKRNIVFIPFRSLSKDKTGHGLGLSIVKSIIQGHGGDITIGESFYKGLKLIIRLPR